jgi:iron uptake system component EfeO
MLKRLSIAILPLALIACGSGAPESDEPTAGGAAGGSARADAEYREQAVSAMHDALLADVQTMRAAVVDLAAAAPTPSDRGWDVEKDAAAIQAMRASWIRARTAYERVEGALAPLFPDLDFSIDARYDDFMTVLGAQGGDHDLFDREGVTGMHAIERVIFADRIPPRVITFERSLPGYAPAAFPATAEQAAAFQSQLCERLIEDIEMLEQQWTPTNIHVAIAYQGLVLLVQEQREKVRKAASNEEESRYSQRTMADLRDNLAGAKAVYALFRPWILSRSSADDPARDGATIDAKIEAGFRALSAAYDRVSGAAIPEPPPTWSAESPSAADLQSPFGLLYTAVNEAVDPTIADSMVAQMNAAAAMLGLDGLGGGQ